MRRNWPEWAQDLPALPTSRIIYCAEELSPSSVDGLASIGYEVVDVRTLPTSSDADHKERIAGWLQGMGEGTIEYDESRRKALELEAKIHGLLVNKSMNLRVTASLEGKPLEDLLALGGKKHLLRKTTPERMAQAVEAGLVPGKKFGVERDD